MMSDRGTASSAGSADPSAAGFTVDPGVYDAVIFDMDGVLTDTARLHARAWKEMFDEYLAARSGSRGERSEAAAPFDIETDYRRYVDGKPRLDGVRSFLAARGIELEEGRPADRPGDETVHGLGNRKNEIFLERLRREGPERFDDAIELVRGLRDAGFGVAVISASRNAREVLERAGIAALFDAVVDGVTAEEEGLDGKPAADVLLEAASRLGAEPGRCVLVEDSVAGVDAGQRARFAAVLGVARGGGGERLDEAGADLVLPDLSSVAVLRTEQAERPIDELPPAIECVEEIAARIGGRQVVYCFDFDGTLAPIVERPEDAAIPDETRRVLADLAGRRIVAVVSGRDLDDVRSRVGVDRVYYAGSHGFRLAGPGGFAEEYEPARRFLPALQRAEGLLGERLAGLEGAQVERKRYAIAVHFRRAAASAEAQIREIVGAVRESCDELRLSEGRAVLERRPALEWDKGRAVRWLLERLQVDPERVFPLYVGDDVTDEDAFRALRRSGLGIVVRGRGGRTRARYALADPAAVRRFLIRLEEVCGS